MEREEIYRILNQAYFGDGCDEADLFEQIAPMVAASRTFVDIGASLGQYTQLAARVMKPGSDILAIEADPIRCEELKRNCRAWQDETGVEIESRFAAVCDREGSIEFQSTNSNISGGLFQHPVKSGNPTWTTVEVPATTLDALFPDAPPDFVKIDVEGVELRIFRGAKAILRARKTIFFVEVHSWSDPEGQNDPAEVHAWMKAHGYHAASIRGKQIYHPDRSKAMRLRTKAKLKGLQRRLLPGSSS